MSLRVRTDAGCCSWTMILTSLAQMPTRRLVATMIILTGSVSLRDKGVQKGWYWIGDYVGCAQVPEVDAGATDDHYVAKTQLQSSICSHTIEIVVVQDQQMVLVLVRHIGHTLRIPLHCHVPCGQTKRQGRCTYTERRGGRTPGSGETEYRTRAFLSQDQIDPQVLQDPKVY